jgi:hypothetical protein
MSTSISIERTLVIRAAVRRLGRTLLGVSMHWVGA